MAATFVTTTSYGTWLPGDLRGYVQGKVILPANPRLLKASRLLRQSVPVQFTQDERERLFEALAAGSEEFGYRLTDATVESWHLHWIVWHGDDSADVMAGRLKTRMRQALGRGRIWTKSYCGLPLLDETALEQARDYIARHAGRRMSAGRAFVGR